MARPIKELRGFARVPLLPGESKTVTFPLAARDLPFWDVRTHAWRVEDAVFDIAVGASSTDLRVQGSLTVAAVAPAGG